MGRVIFFVGRYVLREWVVGEGGLDEYIGEQGLPATLPMGRCSLLVGLRSSSQTLDHIALLLREFSRISWRFRGAMSLTSST